MIPQIHAEMSAKRFGGVAGDYVDIHILIDSTKASFPDNRHRAITHNSWFTTTILPLVFGQQRLNSEGKAYNVKDVGEWHVLEDFRGRFLPSVQDYLSSMRLEPWMDNGIGMPPSRRVVPSDSVPSDGVPIGSVPTGVPEPPATALDEEHSHGEHLRGEHSRMARELLQMAAELKRKLGWGISDQKARYRLQHSISVLEEAGGLLLFDPEGQGQIQTRVKD